MPIVIFFKHCDPAGIVFYPRYAEMLHDTVEHWFNNGLKIGFDNLHGPHNMGIPTVNLHIEFNKPSRLGDHLEAKLYVEHMGRSSMKLNVQLCDDDGDIRVQGHITVVCVSLDGIASTPIPDDFRKRIQPYVKLEE